MSGLAQKKKETIAIPCQSFTEGSVFNYKEVIEGKETFTEEVSVASNRGDVIHLLSKSKRFAEQTATVTDVQCKKLNNTVYLVSNSITKHGYVTFESDFLPAIPLCGETAQEFEYNLIATDMALPDTAVYFNMKKQLKVIGHELITNTAGTFYCTVIHEKVTAIGRLSKVVKNRAIYYADDVGVVRIITVAEAESSGALLHHTTKILHQSTLMDQ